MARRATERLAVSTSTSKAAGLRSTRSSVLQPIEPVEPRIDSRRGWRAGFGEVDAKDMSDRTLHCPAVEAQRYRNATGSTASSPSTRSRIPTSEERRGGQECVDKGETRGW